MAAALGDLFKYIWNTTDQAGPATSTDPAIQALIDKGVITKELLNPARHGSNEDGPFDIPDLYRYNVDPSGIPSTKYGDINSIRPLDYYTGFKTINPDLVYDDPNYGRVTPMANTIDPSSQRDWRDLIGPLAVSAGLAVAGVPLVGTLLSAAKGLGSGNMDWLGLATSAITGGGGDLGIPPELSSALGLVNTGLKGAQTVKALSNQGGQGQQPVPTSSTATTTPDNTVPVPSQFNASMFGDLGSLAAPDDMSQMVASTIAPTAYSNSYGVNSQIIA